MFKKWLPLAITLSAILMGAEILSDFNVINPQLFPPPSAVLAAIRETNDDFFKAIHSTVSNSLKGLGLSFILGTGLAILFSLFLTLRRAVLPLAIFFQTVPIIAIAPLLVIYLGFDDITVISSALIVSIFPIIANTLVGLDQVDEQQIDLFRIYNASSLQVLWYLRLPSSYPALISGLKISSGLALIGTIAGEFVTGSGLGGIIDAARTQQRTDLVFASLYALSAIGLCYLSFINLIDIAIRFRRPYGHLDRRR